jgi:hypothetical protein
MAIHSPTPCRRCSGRTARVRCRSRVARDAPAAPCTKRPVGHRSCQYCTNVPFNIHRGQCNASLASSCGQRYTLAKSQACGRRCHREGGGKAGELNAPHDTPIHDVLCPELESTPLNLSSIEFPQRERETYTPQHSHSERLQVRAWVCVCTLADSVTGASQSAIASSFTIRHMLSRGNDILVLRDV